MDKLAHTYKLLLGPIIGGLSHNSVKLWGRASAAGVLYAWLSDTNPNKAHLVRSTVLEAESGFAGVVEIKGLQPDTSYHYALSLTNIRPSGMSFSTFRTAPAPGQNRNFRFAFGSCFQPKLNLTGTPGEAFQRILTTHTDLSFMIMLGDQIYADDWERNNTGRVASSIADYRDVYLQTWSNSYFREVLKKTPVYMTLDDHEVDNDWHWTDESRRLAEIPFYTKFFRWLKRRPRTELQLPFKRVKAALQGYWEHQGMHAPRLHDPEQVKNGKLTFLANKPSSLAYTFYFGNAAFFIMDTRSMRIWNRRTKCILGEQQWQALEGWLLEVKDVYAVKFIGTSSAFLHVLFGDFAHDRWSSFSKERDRLLNFLATHSIHEVYFLTGDLHSGHAISAKLMSPDDQDIPVWEFCASPFEQKTSWLTRYFTLRHVHHQAFRDYRVHFLVNAQNYGVVSVDYDNNGQPSVHFDLHYLNKDGEWDQKMAY